MPYDIISYRVYDFYIILYATTYIFYVLNKTNAPPLLKTKVWENKFLIIKSVGKCGKHEETTMKKSIFCLILSLLTVFILSGSSSVEGKTESLLGVYVATTIISILILVSYFIFIKKHNLWFILLFASILIVNAGYLSIAISTTLEEALLANRIAYLGSIFLPMSMLMIIINDTNINYKKSLPFILLGIGIAIFLIAATPGYYDIYYKEVALININGVSALSKVYGPWHISYLVYLFAYFGAMVTIVTLSAIKKTSSSIVHSVILAFAVVVNIGVWLLEQFVKIDFELLSISYIISEIFLFGLNLIIQDEERKKNVGVDETKPITSNAPDITQKIYPKDTDTGLQQRLFLDGISALTPTERIIFDLYIAGNGTKDVLQNLNIKENTLKYHNKNIYGKLCVSSRKQLLELAVATNIQQTKV